MKDDITEWLVLMATLPWLLLSIIVIAIYHVLRMPFLLWRIETDEKENHIETNRRC